MTQPEGPLQSPVLTSNLLTALSGRREDVNVLGETVPLIFDGAYLYAIEDATDRERYSRILNHILKAGRIMHYLAPLAKEKIPGFEHIDTGLAVQAAILHDVFKVYGQVRENLTLSQKHALGLPEDFREIMPEVDEVGMGWLKELGFPPEVYGALNNHDFPSQIVDDPYWKLVVVADYMTGQEIMPMEERLADVRKRWIKDPKKRGEKPRIGLKRFKRAREVITSVGNEIFSGIGMTDVGFIEMYDLNSDDSMPKWERFIRHQRETQSTRDREKRTIEVLKILETRSQT